MSRRDTILIAVIVNACLMVMLFIGALKPSNQVQEEIALSNYVPPKPVQKEQTQLTKVKKIPKETVLESTQEKTAPKIAGEVAKAKEPPKKEKVASNANVETVSHKVRKGDSLEKIAKLYQTSVEEIVRRNELDSTNLKIGQNLTLPKAKVLPKEEKVQKASQLEKYYIVKNGDNLWKIALENHLRVEDLLKLNKLNEKKAKALRPGDRLRIK